MALHPDVKSAILGHEFPGSDAAGPNGSPLANDAISMVDDLTDRAMISHEQAVLIVIGVYTFRDNPARLSSYLDSL